MNPPSKWKIGLCLAGLFLAGGVTGSLVTLKVVKTTVAERANPNNWEANAMQLLTQRLKLTPEQQEKIRPALIEAAQDIRLTRVEMLARTTRALATARQEIEPVLTPQQQQEFNRLIQQRRERIRGLMQMQGAGRPPPLPPQ